MESHKSPAVHASADNLPSDPVYIRQFLRSLILVNERRPGAARKTTGKQSDEFRLAAFHPKN